MADLDLTCTRGLGVDCVMPGRTIDECTRIADRRAAWSAPVFGLALISTIVSATATGGFLLFKEELVDEGVIVTVLCGAITIVTGLMWRSSAEVH